MEISYNVNARPAWKRVYVGAAWRPRGRRSGRARWRHTRRRRAAQFWWRHRRASAAWTGSGCLARASAARPPFYTHTQSYMYGTQQQKQIKNKVRLSLLTSVADPDVLGLLDPDISRRYGSGSGSITTRYGSGSGSGSLYNQARKVRKSWIPNFLWLLYDFLSLKNNVNGASKCNKQNNI